MKKRYVVILILGVSNYSFCFLSNFYDFTSSESTLPQIPSDTNIPQFNFDFLIPSENELDEETATSSNDNEENSSPLLPPLFQFSNENFTSIPHTGSTSSEPSSNTWNLTLSPLITISHNLNNTLSSIAPKQIMTLEENLGTESQTQTINIPNTITLPSQNNAEDQTTFFTIYVSSNPIKEEMILNSQRDLTRSDFYEISSLNKEENEKKETKSSETSPLIIKDYAQYRNNSKQNSKEDRSITFSLSLKNPANSQLSQKMCHSKAEDNPWKNTDVKQNLNSVFSSYQLNRKVKKRNMENNEEDSKLKKADNATLLLKNDIKNASKTKEKQTKFFSTQAIRDKIKQIKDKKKISIKKQSTAKKKYKLEEVILELKDIRNKFLKRIITTLRQSLNGMDNSISIEEIYRKNIGILKEEIDEVMKEVKESFTISDWFNFLFLPAKDSKNGNDGK